MMFTESKRKQLHSQLLLPLTQPVFRRSNKFLFKGESQGNSPLISPHDGVKPTTNGKLLLLFSSFKVHIDFPLYR